MTKVLIATEKPFNGVAVNGIKKAIEGAGFEMALLEKYTEKAQLLKAVADVDATIIRSDKIDAEVFDAAKNLKIVVRAGAGYDNVDLAAATASPPLSRLMHEAASLSSIAFSIALYIFFEH